MISLTRWSWSFRQMRSVSLVLTMTRSLSPTRAVSLPGLKQAVPSESRTMDSPFRRSPLRPVSQIPERDDQAPTSDQPKSPFVTRTPSDLLHQRVVDGDRAGISSKIRRARRARAGRWRGPRGSAPEDEERGACLLSLAAKRPPSRGTSPNSRDIPVGAGIARPFHGPASPGIDWTAWKSSPRKRFRSFPVKNGCSRIRWRERSGGMPKVTSGLVRSRRRRRGFQLPQEPGRVADQVVRGKGGDDGSGSWR